MIPLFFSPQQNHDFVPLWKTITTKAKFCCVKGVPKKFKIESFVMFRLTKKIYNKIMISLLHYTTES